MSSANSIRFTFDGTGVAIPAVAEVVEEDVPALKLAPMADVTPANAIKVRNEYLRGSDLRIPGKYKAWVEEEALQLSFGSDSNNSLASETRCQGY